MTVKIEFTIPDAAIREAVRAELNALLPALLAQLLAGTATETGTVPVPAPVDAPAEPPAPEAPAPGAPPEAAPVAPAAPVVMVPPPAARITRGPEAFDSAIPRLPVKLTVKHLTGGVPLPVVCVHGFARGHVPAGHKVRLRAADGSSVVVQQDDEVRHEDGTLSTVVLSFVLGAKPAGTLSELTLDAVPGEPDRAPAITLAEAAEASDLSLRVSGHSFAAEGAFGVSVADVLAAATPDEFGAAPTAWIETVARGPIRNEWRIGGFARRESDDAMHGAVALEAYVRHWTDGAVEITPVQIQPNLFGLHPVGKVGEFRKGYAGIMDVYAGPDRLAAFGGPLDRDARKVPAAAFDAKSSTYAIPAGQNLGLDGWAGGVAVGFSGKFPGGLKADGVYYPRQWGGGKTRLSTARNSDAELVIFSGPATGEVIAYPLVHSFPGSGFVGMDANAEPLFRALPGGAWEGAPRPRALVGFDDAYLTRSSGLLFPMDLTADRTPEPGAPMAYRPGQVMWVSWDLRVQGDNWNAERIGWLPRSHANLALTPFDEVRTAAARNHALMQADFPWNWRNERSGRVPVCTNGPDGKGGEYPGMGRPAPNLFLHNKQAHTSPGVPAFAGMVEWGNNGNGYTVPYSQMNDGSHLPQYCLMPYLTTGHRVYRDLMRQTAATLWASQDPGYIRQRTLKPPMVPAERKFYGVFSGQQRSEGWAPLYLSTLLMLSPEREPETRYLRHLQDENVEYWAAITPHSPARHLGFVATIPAEGPENWEAWTDWGGRQFQHHYKNFAAAALLYRGEERWRGLVETLAVFSRDFFDDANYPNGSGWIAGRYDQAFGAGGKVFAGLAEMVKANAGGNAGPYPARGLSDFGGNSPLWAWNDPNVDPSPKDFATNYLVQQCAVLSMMDRAGIPGCADARGRLMARVLAEPTTRRAFPLSSKARPGEMCLQWSILPRGI